MAYGPPDQHSYDARPDAYYTPQTTQPPPYPEGLDSRSHAIPVTIPDGGRRDSARLTGYSPREDTYPSSPPTEHRPRERDRERSPTRSELGTTHRPRGASSVRPDAGLRAHHVQHHAPPPPPPARPGQHGQEPAVALADAGNPRDAEFSVAQMTQIAQIVEHTIRSMAEKGPLLSDRRPPPPPPTLREDSTASAGSSSTRAGRSSPPPSRRTEAGSSPENLQPSRPPPGPRSPREASRRLAPLPDPEALGPASARPTGNRTVSSLELTPLDKTWGQLFEGGMATERLGQFLRGLANHLIQCFEPAHSIVVTPDKMAEFYGRFRLSAETWSWDRLFKEHSASELSQVYSELECQHHLVQKRPEDAPSVPGLTPHGFERWMMLLILARPDDEVERLQKAVQGLPISNADDARERFPREISRRLFPLSGDVKAVAKVKRAFRVEPSEASTVSHSAPADRSAKDPPETSSSTARAGGATIIERDRQPYFASVAGHVGHDDTFSSPSPPIVRSHGGSPFAPPPTGVAAAAAAAAASVPGREARVEDGDSDVDGPPQAIERKRNPYTAKPGGGRENPMGAKPPSTTRSHRNLMVGGNGGGGGLEIPPPEDYRHNRTSSTVTPGSRRRNQSPPLGSGYSRSDQDLPLGSDTEDSRRRYPRDRERGGDRVRDRDRDRDRERERDQDYVGGEVSMPWSPRVPLDGDYDDDILFHSRDRLPDRGKDRNRHGERDLGGDEYYRATGGWSTAGNVSSGVGAGIGSAGMGPVGAGGWINGGAPASSAGVGVGGAGGGILNSGGVGGGFGVGGDPQHQHPHHYPHRGPPVPSSSTYR